MSLLLRPWPFPVLLALRYLRSTRRDAFASFLSLVAAVGLALGVMALILSLALISGFQEALRGELLGRTPEIEVVQDMQVRVARIMLEWPNWRRRLVFGILPFARRLGIGPTKQLTDGVTQVAMKFPVKIDEPQSGQFASPG